MVTSLNLQKKYHILRWHSFPCHFIIFEALQLHERKGYLKRFRKRKSSYSFFRYAFLVVERSTNIICIETSITILNNFQWCEIMVDQVSQSEISLILHKKWRIYDSLNSYGIDSSILSHNSQQRITRRYSHKLMS